MTDLRKAAEMAIEAIMDGDVKDKAAAVYALRQALAQPEQEPVAWGLPNLQDPIRRKQALLRVDLKYQMALNFLNFGFLSTPHHQSVNGLG